jgi:hypothetical protein
MYHKAVGSSGSAVGERSERATDLATRMRESADLLGQIGSRDPLKIVDARSGELAEARLLVEGNLGRNVPNGARDRRERMAFSRGTACDLVTIRTGLRLRCRDSAHQISP